MTAFEGVIPVLVTAFDDNEDVQLDGYRHQIDFLLSLGVRTVAFGFGSEVFRLTDDELDSGIRASVKHAEGQMDVIANVSENSTRAAIERAQAVAELGASALMVPAPSMVRPSDDEMLRYIAGIADAVELPLVLQDAPGVTGVEMSASLIARMAREIGSIVAIKVESTPAPAKIAEMVGTEAMPIPVLGGNGGVDLLQELRCGARGTMPGPAFPDLFMQILALHAEGDQEAVLATFSRVLPLVTSSLRTMDTFLFVQKEILRRRGVLSSSRLRGPSDVPLQSLLDELEPLLQLARVQTSDWLAAV